MVKLLISFTSLVLLFTCCFFVSSQKISFQNISSRDILSQNVSSQNILPQDISYIYEEPIEGLKLVNSFVYSNIGSLLIWMAFEDKENDLCMLPYFHLRVIDKIGQITYIDLNYTFPVEAVCPISMDFMPLKYNYILISYVKSINGVNKRYGLLINYSSEIIRDDIYLGDVDVKISHSVLDDKGFIIIGKPDEKGITTWRWLSDPDATTGKVEELGSGEFHAPKLPSYTLVDSDYFSLIDGGFGFIYILKYNDETTGSSVIEDPNLQYWRIYVSFLRKGPDSQTIHSLVYQTTEKLNNITMNHVGDGPCLPTYNSEGYVCILLLNNTITNKKNESRTEENYYQLRFLSSGAYTRLDLVRNLTNNMNLKTLVYGGFIVQNRTNITARDYYVLDDNGNYSQPGGSFGPGFIHYNIFRKNNTIFGIKPVTDNKLEILLKPIPKLINRGVEYDSPTIESTEPAINEVIDPSIDEITVKFAIPVKLSTANVSIFQLNDDPSKPSLLRQTISGDSKLCKVGYDNHTVHIPIFKSTFNQPNSTYYVVIENNFVSSQTRDEPLVGVYEKTWMFSIKPFKAAQHSDSITGLLRLNEEGSSKFLQTTNRSGFFKDMVQSFAKIIPVNEQRLSTNNKWQHDSTSAQKVLLSFSINEAKVDTIDPSSQIIFDNLNELIKYKGYTELSNNEYTSLIDETAPFKMTKNYLEEFSPLIITVIVSSIVLITLYFLARRKNPKGRNSVIFEMAFIIQDFTVDLLFTLLKVKNVSVLVTPSIIFLVVPIIINCLLGLIIVVYEITTNPSFVTWFSEFPILSSVFTLLSAFDIRALNTLSSDLFGLKIFSAPLTQKSRKIMLCGSIISIFIEDVPQLIIQKVYNERVVEAFDLVPTLVFISGVLVIGNKLILSTYHALVRWQHRRDKIRDLIRHLSITSFRSVRSHVGT